MSGPGKSLSVCFCKVCVNCTNLACGAIMEKGYLALKIYLILVFSVNTLPFQKLAFLISYFKKC